MKSYSRMLMITFLVVLLAIAFAGAKTGFGIKGLNNRAAFANLEECDGSTPISKEDCMEKNFRNRVFINTTKSGGGPGTGK